jgi:hypothetical protein
MKKILAIIALTTAVSVFGVPAFAQGSEEGTDYALSWGAVGGSGGTYGGSYARYGHVRHPHRWN